MALGGTQVAAMFGVLELKDNMSAGLDNAMNKMHEMSTAGKVMRGGLLVGAAGATALAAGLGVAISEAMEAQVNIAKLDAVLKATGGAAGVTSQRVQEMATRLSRVTRFSDDAIIKGETMLLTFKEIGEDTFPRATEAMLDIAEMMGTDSVTAATLLGKALNDPIQGVTALRRYGVQLTEAQEEQIKSFMAVNDVASAQAIILGEVEAQFGGIARAAGDTLAGKITIAKNAIMDFAEGIGMKMLPGIEAAVGWLSDRLPSAFNAILEVWDGGGLIAVGELIIGGIKQGVGDVAAWAQANIIDPLVGAITGFFTRRNPLADFFLAPIDYWQFVGKITYPGMEPGSMPPLKLSPAFSLEGAGSAFDDLVASVPNRLEDLLNNLFGAAVDIGTAVKAKLIDPIVTYLGTVNWAEALATGASTLGDIMDALATGWDNFSGWVRENILYPTVEWILTQDWAGALATGTAVLSKIMDAIGGAWDDFKGWIDKNIIKPIANELGGITAADWIGANVEVGNLITTVLDAIASGVTSAISVFFPFVWFEIILPISKELIKPELWKAALTAVGAVLLGAITIAATVGVWAIEKLGELAQALIDAVPAAAAKLWNLGKELAEGIWDGLKANVNGWLDKLIAEILGTGGGEGPTKRPTGFIMMPGYGEYHQTKQHGGPVFAQQNYLVGERGPELFVPSTPGTIVPNHALGGQTIIIQAVYIQDEDPQRWLDRLTDAARMRGSQVVPVM